VASEADLLRHNTILRDLPEEEFGAVAARLRVREIEVRDSAYAANEPVTEIFFPLTAVFSMVALADDGEVISEVGTVGREGMVGLPLFLGVSSSPLSVFCQIPGRTAVMTARDLRAALAGDGALHRRLNTFVQATMVMLAQNVVCLTAHLAEARAARWLLMTHDRVVEDEFPLTQEFLGQMLGVRRSTVSEIAGKLQANGLIRYSRGRLTILDRPGLEAQACSCYAVVRQEFARTESTGQG
jgi:CRP-like cAMP-binding protein